MQKIYKCVMQLSTTLFFSFSLKRKNSKKRKPKPHQIKKKKETQKKKKKTQWQEEGPQKLKSFWEKGKKMRLQHTKLLEIFS